MLYNKLRRCSRLIEESNKIARGMADIIKKEASYLDENIYCCYHNHYDFPVYSVYTSQFYELGFGINISIRLNKGRTKKGIIVTKSKAGDSWHNYGLAIDIVIILDTNNDGLFPSHDKGGHGAETGIHLKTILILK